MIAEGRERRCTYRVSAVSKSNFQFNKYRSDTIRIFFIWMEGKMWTKTAKSLKLERILCTTLLGRCIYLKSNLIIVDELQWRNTPDIVKEWLLTTTERIETITFLSIVPLSQSEIRQRAMTNKDSIWNALLRYLTTYFIETPVGLIVRIPYFCLHKHYPIII